MQVVPQLTCNDEESGRYSKEKKSLDEMLEFILEKHKNNVYGILNQLNAHYASILTIFAGSKIKRLE